MAVYIVWDENSQADIHSVEELNQLLDQLADQAKEDMPLSVELYMHEKMSMYIVVGSDLSPVCFLSTVNQPHIVSSRSQYADNDGYFEFNHRGHHSAVHRKFTVPIDDARRALFYFFETGKQPENIKWE